MSRRLASDGGTSQVAWGLGGLGFRVEVQGLGFRVQVQGLGFRVQVQGLGFRVELAVQRGGFNN